MSPLVYKLCSIPMLYFSVDQSLTRRCMWIAMRIFFFLSIIFLASASLQLRNDWEAWKREHGKTYADTLEESLRHAIWFQNYHYIEDHNKRESFKLNLNEFADLVGLFHFLIYSFAIHSLSVYISDKWTVHSKVPPPRECRSSTSIC